MDQRIAGLLFAAGTGLSWAFLAIALKYASAYADSGTIVFIRMAVASLALGAYFSLFQPKQLKIFRFPPLLGVLAGVCLAANYFGFMTGVEMTTASNTQIMIQMGPMTLCLVGIFYFKESPTRTQVLGMLIALLGFSLFSWDQIVIAAEKKSAYLQGNLWIFMAAMTWVLFATFQKILQARFSAQQLNLLIYVAAAIALAPLCDFSLFSKLDGFQWFILILTGLNTLIAYGCLAEAFKRIPASHVSLIITCNPLITLALLAALAAFEIHIINPEPIDKLGYLGALFVVVGVATALRK